MSEYGKIHTDGSRSGGQPLDDSIEQKAQALVSAVRAEYPDVSEGAAEHLAILSVLRQTKIKPDPLVQAMNRLEWCNTDALAKDLRAELEAFGLEIREKNDD